MSKTVFPFVLAGLLLTFGCVEFALAGNGAQITIVKTADQMLTCTDKNGNEHTIKVAKDAKITCDGKACKLDDLQKGQKAAVMGMVIDGEKMITAIEARSK